MTGENEFTIRLFSHEIRVIVESPAHWSEGGMGRASLIDQTIRLNDALPNDTRHSTLLHEVIHLISDLTGVELSEVQVDAVTQGMFTLLKDNPELVADIAGLNSIDINSK